MLKRRASSRRTTEKNWTLYTINSENKEMIGYFASKIVLKMERDYGIF